jgi:hypothetical protein
VKRKELVTGTCSAGDRRDDDVREIPYDEGADRGRAENRRTYRRDCYGRRLLACANGESVEVDRRLSTRERLPVGSIR